MPIVSKKPLAPPTIKPVIPKVEPDKNQSVFIDTRYQPLSSLLKYTQGAVWTVNYYSQYHDRDNATYAQDPGQSPIYQQFRKIERLELRVESPLNQQQDQESKGFSVKGSAYAAEPNLKTSLNSARCACVIRGVMSRLTGIATMQTESPPA